MAGQTKYERDLRRKLRTRELVPELATPNFLERLDRIAHRALLRRTVEGNLAAIIVYHQLVEEMLRLLLRDCEVFLQLAAFPAEIHFPARQKQMFGQLHQTLSMSLEFRNKQRILARAAQINTLRIAVVHNLVKAASLAGLRKRALRTRRLYEATFSLFDDAHDWFRLCFKDFRKDVFEIY